MKRSNRLVIFVGVLLAILAFVGIVIVLNQSGTGTSNNEPTTAKVLVAKQAIEIGTAVTPEMVEVKEVPIGGVIGTPYSDPSQVGGQPALVNVPAGSQVNHETFGTGTTLVDIAAQLKPGERAIAIQLDRTTGLNFLAKPGDSVDVVLAEEITVLQPAENQTGGTQRFEVVNGLEKARTVKTILQNKRVLYVSTTLATQATPAPGATPAPNAPAQNQALPDSIILIIAGTDQDAELLKFAQKDQTERGAVSITIRAVNDTDVETTTGITIDKLVTQYGVPIPGIVQLPVQKP